MTTLDRSKQLEMLSKLRDLYESPRECWLGQDGARQMRSHYPEAVTTTQPNLKSVAKT